MPLSPSQSLGDIAFMMAEFAGADTHEILQLGEGINKKFVFKPPRLGNAWKGQLPRHSKIAEPVFGIPFGVKRKRAGCWVFGSNTNLNEVDFKIARDNRHGVGKKCFRIDFLTHTNGYPVLRVTNESDSAQLYVQHSEFGTTDAIYLARGDWDEIRAPVYIHHPKFSFRIWPPTRTKRENELFVRHTQHMDKLAVDEALEYWPPLDSGSATVDEASRISLDGNLYTKIPDMGGSEGSYGTVFIVKRVGADSVTLCAKELKLGSDWVTSSTAKRQNEEIQKEFESYRRFAHPHLAAAVDIAYMQDGSAPPWLILEHIPFGLADYICHSGQKPWPRRPLPLLSPSDIILQLFSFVSFLHNQGFVHRDLSANNIRLYPDKTRWVVKVIDLGALESVHRLRQLAGTAGFMAPEMLNHQPHDEKVDIFSLGMIAFYLLTGVKHKWPKGKALSLSYQAQWMREEAFPELDRLDHKFKTLLGGLLAYEAKNRWTARQVINYFWSLDMEANPDCRKRSASPEALPSNKRHKASPAATIRGARAPPERSLSPTMSFDTAAEQAQPPQPPQPPQGGLLSVPGTPFTEDDFDAESANHRSLLSQESERTVESLIKPDPQDWDFTFDLEGWLDRSHDTPYTWLYQKQQTASEAGSSAVEAEIALDPQLGPSWLTGYTQDVQKLGLRSQTPARTMEPDTKAETDILTTNRLQSELGAGSQQESDSELDIQYSYLQSVWPRAESQSEGLAGREVTPSQSEAIALEGVVSYSSSANDMEAQATPSLMSLSSSCHEDWSWEMKERRRSQGIEEGARLDGSFGTKPTYPRENVLSPVAVHLDAVRHVEKKLGKFV